MSNREPGRAMAHPPASPVAARAPNPRTRPDRAGPSAEERGGRAALAQPARLVVRGDEPPEHLFRRLLSAYLGGARSFEVSEETRLTAGTRDVVREFCRRTRQPEIVRDDGHRIELDDVEPAEVGELDERLLRLGELVVRFHREAVESWSRLPLGDDGHWSQKDDALDREAWFLERCIARDEGRQRQRSRPATAAWTIARSLERIADHAVTLGEVGPRLAHLGPEGSPIRELRQFHRQAMAHLEEVLGAPDGSCANDLLDVGEALAASGRALSDRLLPAVGDGTMSPATAAAVARALEAVGRTVAYTQDIAQAFFDRSLRTASTSLPQVSTGAVGVPGS